MINNLATTQMIQNIINGTTPPTQAANATNATNAENATSAITATNAENATNATNAESAANATFFGTCSSAASTSAKTVTIDGFTSENLTNGTRIAVYFTYNNTSSSPTLNVSSTGALNLVTQTGTELTGTVGDWAAGSLVSFVYYNNEWVLQSPTLIATLNGAEYFAGNTEPTWYAPTSAGTDGYVLVSNGSGAPSWVNLLGSATLKSTLTATGQTYNSSVAFNKYAYVFIQVEINDGAGSTYVYNFFFTPAMLNAIGDQGIGYSDNRGGGGAIAFPSTTSFTSGWYDNFGRGSMSFSRVRLYTGTQLN